jgi:hypothetical protein
MASVYSDHQSSMVASVIRTIGSKVKHNNKHFTIKNNQYNSKLMAIISHIPAYHVIRYNLMFIVFYMHDFHKLIIFIILSLITYFHKIEFTVVKSIFHVSCKHACFSTQNNHAMQKIIISIHLSFYSP